MRHSNHDPEPLRPPRARGHAAPRGRRDRSPRTAARVWSRRTQRAALRVLGLHVHDSRHPRRPAGVDRAVGSVLHPPQAGETAELLAEPVPLIRHLCRHPGSRAACPAPPPLPVPHAPSSGLRARLRAGATTEPTTRPLERNPSISGGTSSRSCSASSSWPVRSSSRGFLVGIRARRPRSPLKRLPQRSTSPSTTCEPTLTCVAQSWPPTPAWRPPSPPPGVPRHVAEAPLEYLERVLLSLDTSADAVRSLTDLFEWARFSHHEPEPSMRDDAVDALIAVRDELRASELTPA